LWATDADATDPDLAVEDTDESGSEDHQVAQDEARPEPGQRRRAVTEKKSGSERAPPACRRRGGTTTGVRTQV
jgi:hypothetical protein